MKVAATSQWQPVALHVPQDVVEVRLVAGARFTDVTNNNVIAALKPLSIAICLDVISGVALDLLTTPELQFVDRRFGRVMGVLRLQRVNDWQTGGHTYALFEVRRGINKCAGWPRQRWDAAIHRLMSLRKRGAGSFTMAPTAVEQSMVFYICPRPVFLVSVEDGEHSNIFPMDLVGPVGPERFTLALRSSSPSVETIKSARRVALSGIAADDYKIAYQLGAHHRKVKIDITELPFRVKRSRRFALPVPQIALFVREIEILDLQSIGSHTLFLGRVVELEGIAEKPQLFHTCGIYQKWRSRSGAPFQLPQTAP